MARYATTIEASKRWNMTPEAICQKCERGEVSGARRFEGIWNVPVE